MRQRLGEYLVESGIITPDQLRIAQHRQAETRQPFGRILRDAGWLASRTLAEALAEQLALEYVDVRTLEPDLDALRMLPREAVETLGILPVRRDAAALVVALADPLDIALLEELELRAGCAVEPVIADEEVLPTAIAAAYDALATEQTAVSEARSALHRVADSPAVRHRLPRLICCASSAPETGVSTLVQNVAVVAQAVGHQPVILELTNGGRTRPDNLLTHPLAEAGPADRADPGAPVPCFTLGSSEQFTRARDMALVTLARNVLTLGQSYDPILVDVGCPSGGPTARLLAAGDVSVLLTTPQDPVRAYDLIRDLASNREGAARPTASIGRLTLGIVVTLVNDAAAARRVFEQLQRAVEDYLNPEPPGQPRVELVFLGTVRWQPLARVSTETAAPKAPGAWSEDQSDFVSVTKAVMDRAARVRPDPWPMAGLVNFACGDA